MTNSPNTEQELITLSKDKWQWMADKNVDKLNDLVDEKAMFVHMGGSFDKSRELEIIQTGFVWYKQVDIHKVSVNIIGSTAILLNKITLSAVVNEHEVITEFEVTEVYIQQQPGWKLGALSFTKLLVP